MKDLLKDECITIVGIQAFVDDIATLSPNTMSFWELAARTRLTGAVLIGVIKNGNVVLGATDKKKKAYGGKNELLILLQEDIDDLKILQEDPMWSMFDSNSREQKSTTLKPMGDRNIGDALTQAAA